MKMQISEYMLKYGINSVKTQRLHNLWIHTYAGKV